MLAEWGIVGLLPVLLALVWLLRWVMQSFRPGHAEAIPLACVLVLLLAHAYLDLIFWFTPLMFVAAFVAAAMIAFVEQSTAETADISS
jgi:O-antigen ligase